jgi:hypothetical protein
VFAAGGNQSTSTSAPQTFTSNFTNQATSQPTIFTTTTTTTTTTTGGTQDLTSGFDSTLTSTLDSTTTTTTRVSGGGGVNDFNAYTDSREEPNRLLVGGDRTPEMLLIPQEDYIGTEILGESLDGEPVTFTATELYKNFNPFTYELFSYRANAGPGASGALVEQTNGANSELRAASVLQENITGVGLYDGKAFIRSGDGSNEEGVGLVKVSELGSATVEGFLRMGDGRQRPTNSFPLADAIYFINSPWGQFEIQWRNDGPTIVRGYRITFSDSSFDVLYQETYGFLDPGFGSSQPALTEGAWYHFAMVQDDGRLAAYFEGQRLVDRESASPAAWSESVPWLAAGLSSFGTSINEFHPGAIHGLRFTPRALYSGPSFTPPVSITTFS